MAVGAALKRTLQQIAIIAEVHQRAKETKLAKKNRRMVKRKMKTKRVRSKATCKVSRTALSALALKKKKNSLTSSFLDDMAT